MHGQVTAHSWAPVNEWGDNINAALIGQPSPVPVPLMLLYSQVDDGQVSWQQTRGNVSFSADNGAVAGNAVLNGDGVYQTTIVTGPAPGINRVSFSATGLDVPAGIPTSLSSPLNFVTGLDPQITAIAPARINLDPFGFSQTPIELSYQIAAGGLSRAQRRAGDC